MAFTHKASLSSDWWQVVHQLSTLTVIPGLVQARLHNQTFSAYSKTKQNYEYLLPLALQAKPTTMTEAASSCTLHPYVFIQTQ